MLNKQKILALLAASGLMLSCPIAAHQDVNDTQDFQTWGNVTAIGKFDALGITNPKLANFRWWMEGQGRFGDDSTRFSQSLIRPGLGYQIHRTTTLWVGYAWAPTTMPFASRAFDENRLWQQVLWTERYSFGTVALRSRFEERWVEHWKGDDTAYRFRQLARVLIPLPQAPAFGLVLANEIFVHLNAADWGPRSGFDQNRAFAGVAYTVNKNARAEIGYMNQTLNRINNSHNLMDHILSANLFLNF